MFYMTEEFLRSQSDERHREAAQARLVNGVRSAARARRRAEQAQAQAERAQSSLVAAVPMLSR